MKLDDAYPKPPLHNLLMPHDCRYLDPADERACPPNCPYRVWFEQYRQLREGDWRCPYHETNDGSVQFEDCTCGGPMSESGAPGA